MTIDLSAFSFDVKPLGLDAQVDVIAHVPLGLSTKNGLLEALKVELKFPDYFGHNWDALSDCLRDFHWMNKKRIVLVHEDLPKIEESSLRIYIDVLSDAVKDWGPNEDHILVVVFPPESKSYLKSLA
jgi:RNAse (barnase) inhibitor barstar